MNLKIYRLQIDQTIRHFYWSTNSYFGLKRPRTSYQRVQAVFAAAYQSSLLYSLLLLFYHRFAVVVIECDFGDRHDANQASFDDHHRFAAAVVAVVVDQTTIERIFSIRRLPARYYSAYSQMRTKGLMAALLTMDLDGLDGFLFPYDDEKFISHRFLISTLAFYFSYFFVLLNNNFSLLFVTFFLLYSLGVVC